MTVDWSQTGAPPLVGGTLHRALSLLSQAGLPSPEVRLVEGDGPRGRIIAQDPRPGAEFDPSEPLALTVLEDNPIAHLPEVMREDDRDAEDSGGHPRPQNMLRRMLMMTQHLIADVERQVDHMDEQLSPEGASPAMLGWLGERIPLVFEPHWAERQVREVLRKAPEIKAARGTAEGLTELIRLRTGLNVRVVENAWPHGGVIAGHHRVGREVSVATVPFEDDAFYVELPADAPTDGGTMERLLTVIDEEKPVHLRCCVVRARVEAPPVEIDDEPWEITGEIEPTLEADAPSDALDIPLEADAPAGDLDIPPGPEISGGIFTEEGPMPFDDPSSDGLIDALYQGAPTFAGPIPAHERDPFETPSEAELDLAAALSKDAPSTDDAFSPRSLTLDLIAAPPEPGGLDEEAMTEAEAETLEAASADELEEATDLEPADEDELDELVLDETGKLSARLSLLDGLLKRRGQGDEDWQDDVSLNFDNADTDDTLVRHVVEGLQGDDDDTEQGE